MELRTFVHIIHYIFIRNVLVDTPEHVCNNYLITAFSYNNIDLSSTLQTLSQYLIFFTSICNKGFR